MAIYSGITNWKLWFSIVMLVYQRAYTDWWFQTFFPYYIWDNPSHWLSYFSKGLKPPTSTVICPNAYYSLLSNVWVSARCIPIGMSYILSWGCFFCIHPMCLSRSILVQSLGCVSLFCFNSVPALKTLSHCPSKKDAVSLKTLFGDDQFLGFMLNFFALVKLPV